MNKQKITEARKKINTRRNYTIIKEKLVKPEKKNIKFEITTEKDQWTN